MGERSIGEALGELRKEFPDISVSKIRFLESQGLVAPSRTASGYRQFSDDDVACLRWILTQQREHYLPLKVIRRHLRDHPMPWMDAGEIAVEGAGPAEVGEGPAVAPSARPLREEPLPARVYSRTELAAAAGLDEDGLAELESFGLLPAALDRDALTVVQVAARFFAYGVEARHLRMYKTFAEREAALLAQVVMPIAGPRGETAAEARAAADDLAALGAEMRNALLRIALGPAPSSS